MYPSQASKGGRVLAQEIAPYYFKNPNVTAAILDGSVARGWADEFSDVEIAVFWAAPPTDSDRRRAIERIGCEVWKFDQYTHEGEEGAIEHLGLTKIEVDGKLYEGTVMVSVQHLTVESVETCLKDVLDGYDTTIGKQNLLSVIQHGVPLYGSQVVDRWRARTANYPDGLARKMVEENLWLGPWFYPKAYASRDDRLVLFSHFCLTTRRLLNVLLGLNRIYHPSSDYKWMEQMASHMQTAPNSLSSRLKKVFQSDIASAGEELLSLIHDTLALVEQHMPGIDTRQERRRWQESHPYTLLSDIGAKAFRR